jgi:flagellar motor protein MotB
VDFSSPDTQRALEAMVAERFGTSTLKALKDEVKKQSAAAAAGTAQAKEKAPDPGRLSKELYARLVENEPLPEAALTELAAARAQSIVVELTATGGVAPERVSLKNPEPVTSGEPATAKLFLVVAQKSP